MRRICLVLLLFCACALMAGSAGCGSASVMEDPLELFEASRQAFEAADSVQMEATCVITVEYCEDVPDDIRTAFTNGCTEMVSLKFRMESQREDNGLWMIHESMEAGSGGPFGSSRSADFFVYGDRVYFEASPGQWYYRDAPGLADYQSGSQSITPASIEQYMEYCESVEVTEETRQTITYSLVLGEKYFDRMAEEIHKVQGPVAEKAAQELESVKEFLKDAEPRVTLDKATGYPVSGKLLLRLGVPDFIRMIDPGLEDPASSGIIANTGGSYVVWEYEYKFSRYGEDLRVTLPQKVIETAQPMPEKAE